MESNRGLDLDPNKDDLPLRANTNHMLVRHYVLDLTVHFQRKVIGGSIVLFLEPGVVSSKQGEPGSISNTPVQNISQVSSKHDVSSPITPEPNKVIPPEEPSRLCGGNDVSSVLWCDESEEFTLVLDCCDLTVSKVEELDVTAVPDLKKLDVDQQHANTDHPSSSLVQRLVSMPSVCWRLQHELYVQCSRSPTLHNAQPLRFHTDRWSLQIRKEGVCAPHDFPRAVRIWYETKLTGGSVRWTKDQDGRCCVYTMGSPINNRALFPCQEPPVAMSTWQARVRAPCDYTVLMSGENQAFPKPADTGFLQWDYYVTMPMPASTFTIAVGQWLEAGVKHLNFEMEKTDEPYDKEPSFSLDNDDQQYVCSHMDYPCHFMVSAARAQTVIPHRVFAPPCHLQKANDMVLPLLPLCLTAAHSVLGVHPFSRLDVLIVPSGFSSLGMASPHIVFLSQSVLTGERNLCGARLCHEIAHSWFGLAIGAQDWTEEWISEGFATYLEDVFWSHVQKLGCREAEEQRWLKALLRWRRLSDELQNSEEELQVLRPNKENTGEVSESGASVVKHALNPEKPFMQVHYLKGYFLLKFLADQVGEEKFLDFFKVFVGKFHGQLILSQDFLQTLLDTFPGMSSRGITLETIFSDWLDTPEMPEWLRDACSEWLRTPVVQEVKGEVAKWIHFSGSGGKGSKQKRAGPKVNFKELSPEQLVLLLEFLLEEPKLSLSTLRLLQTTYNLQAQDAEVKHRWCELVVKHKHTAAYRDVEQFLIHDQAMGVYLYGELMVQEDARQQALARRCLSIIKDDMDQSACSVVEEMIL
ncbi:aminopeptidase O isoform X2 [Sinocyclocheilus rhinocerous]|uniref:aminopeptidase O isoform X2 n=1 Tax=Sinocyclocheilus rhinocerous TaxID=307959 RepID=UPI0007B8DE0A|nr:PREDICTED: aminopeptidase O isoform X2 [Sinocyclocheilus rhinocerous]